MTKPRREGLAAMAAAFGADVKVVEVRRLTGGVATAVHLIEMATDRSGRTVVLKRFPPGIGAPEKEWDALSFMQGAAVPTPAPLYYDAGAWFGGPAIVMSALPGALSPTPKDLRSWVAALADTLARIHATPLDGLPPSMRRLSIWDRWDDRGLSPGARTSAIAAAISELRTLPWELSVCHCDFHPGNVLFQDGSVVGVVDWSAGKLAPYLSDLGRLRAALAIWPGGDAPDAVAVAYTERTGRQLDGLPYWDVLSGAITLNNAAAWAPLYDALHVPLNPVEVAGRATAFIDTALSRLGALPDER
jgi:aminoglycoside phosphotransferase (APT) family kinase protein